MNRIERITALINDRFDLEDLEIIDDSHQHAGHKGHDGGEHTHIRIRCVCNELAQMSRVNAHRALNQLLKDEFDTGLHAVSYELVI